MEPKPPTPSAEIEKSYDEAPYPSAPFEGSTPDRLATVATLFGMEPADVERARVLELGCGRGGNLIPLAVAYPDSYFLGVDLSSVQIAEARQVTQNLNLRNVEFRQADLMNFEVDPDSIDFLIAHGLYSWVPHDVRDRILEICRRCLRPAGIVYISYNTFPGWHMHRMVREMLLHHVSDVPSPRQKVSRARELLDLLAENNLMQESAYGRELRFENERLKGKHDSYILHEHLDTINEPVYFQDFVSHAKRYGLKYLGESDFNSGMPIHFSPAAQTYLAQFSDEIMREQYIDFLRGQSFRATLLCHEWQPLRRSISTESFLRLRVESALRPISAQPNLAEGVSEEFDNGEGGKLICHHSIAKAALCALTERYPAWPRFPDLLEEAMSRLPTSMAAGIPSLQKALAESLMEIHGLGARIWFHSSSPPMALEVDRRPVASPLARLQAQQGNVVTNLCHRNVELRELSRLVLPLLDGTHSRHQVTKHLVKMALHGAVAITKNDKPVMGASALQVVVSEATDDILQGFLHNALLVG